MKMFYVSDRKITMMSYEIDSNIYWYFSIEETTKFMEFDVHFPLHLPSIINCPPYCLFLFIFFRFFFRVVSRPFRMKSRWALNEATYTDDLADAIDKTAASSSWTTTTTTTMRGREPSAKETAVVSHEIHLITRSSCRMALRVPIYMYI